MEERAITREELAELLTRYNIGKKPLAKLLGWGETTVLLYSEAKVIPDNEFTRKLYHLYKDVPAYAGVLEQNADAITRVAYRKSAAAVRELFKPSKILNCADYVLKKGLADKRETSLLRLETVIFWSQLVAICIYGYTLFKEDYQPSKTGMPYRSVEERFRTYGCICPELGLRTRPVPAKPEDSGEAVDLSETDREILDFVSDMFDWYGSSALQKLSEAERYRLCGPKNARRRRIVSTDTLRRCYTEVFSQSKVQKLKDLEGYMQKRIAFVKKWKPEQ